MNLPKLIQKIPLRLILSVIAGFATSAVLSVITHEILHLAGVLPGLRKPVFDTNLLLICLAYHSLYAVVGAFVTAMFAKEYARKAVFFYGSKSAIMYVLGIILLWKHHPAWYNLTKAALGIPLALLGGWLYKQYKARKLKPETV